jgi:hexosaminidase
MKLIPHLLILIVVLASCKPKEASSDAKAAFAGSIPKPVSVEPGNEALTITGGPVEYKEGTTKVGDKVFFSLITDAQLGDEGYEININTESITISANKPAGLFYGAQTLDQIGVKTAEGTEFSTGKIRDYPTFGWRGSMLDVARHFFGVDDIKDYIDKIAYYKMNVLHLHLSDDQGWRIEIKSWPKLTEIGGKTQVDGGGGGFYTQEQYKEIVAYAASRYVTIIPEIDMPSHINAALASYPELYCKGVGREPALYEGNEVGFSTLCRKDKASEDATLKFVNDVVREISAINPSPYMHIGGDEAHVTKKEDYIAFINAFKKIIEANGKHMIGWEEIAQANIGAGDISQHWHSKEYAAESAKKGAKVLMSPATKIYLDMKYDTTIKLGQKWAALIEVDDSYNWKVEDFVPGVNMDNIIGIEAPLWTEKIYTMNDIEFMLFPRLPGIAEIAWSPQDRNWDEYKLRLAKHAKKMEEKGINFYKSPKVPW